MKEEVHSGLQKPFFPFSFLSSQSFETAELTGSPWISNYKRRMPSQRLRSYVRKREKERSQERKEEKTRKYQDKVGLVPCAAVNWQCKKKKKIRHGLKCVSSQKLSGVTELYSYANSRSANSHLAAHNKLFASQPRDWEILKSLQQLRTEAPVLGRKSPNPKPVPKPAKPRTT